MKISNILLLVIGLLFTSLVSQAQNDQSIVNEGPQKPTLISHGIFLGEVPSLASQMASGTFQPAVDVEKEVNPKHWGSNTSVPGKGLPKGNDPLWERQSKATMKQGRAPSLTFEAASASATPSDPTGAVGPNHFMNSWNTSFRIFDKAGNPLIAAASLGTILPGTMGDPIVFYDRYADRFLITEFYSNGFDVAISKGPNPVTSGWYVYRFPTNTFPDYPKFTVWSDGYYITANKDQSSASTSQVVFALERDKMIAGNATPQMIGFALTDIITSGFYSPMGFNANGSTLPPAGNAPIVYMQDDAWSGVTADHLKIWSINVNWTTPASSTISSPQILNTQPFDGLFDGGSFVNLPQPSGSDIDALQATIMYMAQYRRFASYNSVVFNFVVDLNGADNLAGIRWYELRQTTDGAPWSIYQEGTYSQPAGLSAFCGNMCMDASGNIALAYTTVGSAAGQYPSLRYTGRYASDPLGTMTLSEEVIRNGEQVDPASRYGDYAQMTIDPTDDASFWSIGECFYGSARKNHVGVFQIAPPSLTALFTGSPAEICTGGTVSFTDQSLASPTSWTWTFPGGTPSSFNGQSPPAITYSTPGTYNVVLSVSDGTNTDVLTKTAYISVKSLIAGFTAVPASVVVGNTVTFTDNSLCSPTTWEWSFPGGSPSTYSGMTPPPITYSTIGTYDVSLTITKPGGTDTKTKTSYINVMAPEFNMTNGSITSCTGNFYDSGGLSGSYADDEDLTETFYPSTSGAMVRFTFNSFETEAGYDYLRIYNGTSTTAPLIGTYNGTTGPGTVTASNASGALTFNFTTDGSGTRTGWAAAISCFSATDPPVAAFAASSVTPAVNTTVTFTDQSTNLPTSWAWSFSPNTVTYVGGTTASSQNPQVQFTAIGTYTVSLTATNGFGSDSEIKTNYIDAINCTFTALPFTESFTATSLPSCWTQVDHQGNGQIWKFGIITSGTTLPALTGNYAYLNSDAYGSGNSQNADLITPTLDLSGYGTINLAFNHYFRSYSGSSGTLAYSIDNGTTWTTLATYTTTSGSNPTTFTQAVNAAAGQTQVKFKWNYTGSYGYYWGIDDINITGSAAGPPVVTTTAASAINVTTVTAGGVVTSAGTSSVTARGVCWSTSASPTIAGEHTTDASGTGSFTSSLTGLVANTLYHIRAYATNLSGTSYGEDLTFTTLSGLPVVTTITPSSITNTSATSGGSVSSEGGAAVTARGVCWSTTADPVTSGNHTTDGTGTGTFSSSITGLSNATTYHVRAYATNSYGAAYGSDISFSTACITINSFPWNEGFETAATIPACWTQEFVTTPGLNWTYVKGNGGSYPATAHGGNRNALLKDNTSADNKTKLVSPSLDLSALGSPQLTFWHYMAVWAGDQDQLTVYYKTSASGTWVSLAAYTASVTAWTQRTLSLPAGTSDYYIAFEGNAKYGYGVCVDDVSVTGISNKNLNVKVFPEGLFNGTSLNKAQGTSGDQFAGSVADQITVELHNALAPYALAGGPYTINLNTDGTAAVTIPGSLNGSYYIAVKHRNSIETWSGTPLSFSGSTVSHDFTTLANQAYGNNMKLIAGKYVIYSGDANQDGAVNATDIASIQSASSAFNNGYIPEDINGDGLIDSADMILVDNNSANLVLKHTP